MNNFEFYSPAHLVFGKGVEMRVGEMLVGSPDAIVERSKMNIEPKKA